MASIDLEDVLELPSVDLGDIHPITDFKRRTPEFLAQLREAPRPLVLTVGGKAEVVMLRPDFFQQLYRLADEALTLKALRRGLDQVAAGETVSADEFFERLAGLDGAPGSDHGAG